MVREINFSLVNGLFWEMKVGCDWSRGTKDERRQNKPGYGHTKYTEELRCSYYLC